MANRGVSFVIPTLNSSATLKDCLLSIASQDFPKDKYEILLIDGGSQDRTLSIAKDIEKQSGVTLKIYSNPLMTCEAGKSIGIEAATHDMVALIDSDNILEGNDWVKRMLEPFSEIEDLAAAEPLFFSYRKRDPLITRYCALLGVNDPLCFYLGNYDRLSQLTGKWSSFDIQSIDHARYFTFELSEDKIPTIGANGFLVKRQLISKNSFKPYFFDVDSVYALIKSGHRKFAKVKIGIVHIYSDSVGCFVKKQRRRILDYLYYHRQQLRLYPWQTINKRGLVKFVLFSATLLIPTIDAVRGYHKIKDRAWFFHPFACFITLWVYFIGILECNIFHKKMFDRSNW